jgi:ATP phosphoribosyltransferase regulatory subunit HisZ
MTAWVLPDHIADVLPSEARHIEELRRLLLDSARVYGYELVMPPLLEHLESLLTGTGEALGLQTFKLVDQLSGRTLGLRADTTPQVARIDAHLLNRDGVTRLCYCGPVLHTRADRPHATREPLQFGAEIYGHAGLEADLEVQCLAIECLRAAGLGPLQLDMADVRIVSAVLADASISRAMVGRIHAALAAKDAPELAQLLRQQPAVPARAAKALQAFPKIRWIAGGLGKDGGIAALAPHLGSVVKAYLIGHSARDFALQIGEVPHEISETMARAVARAAAEAEPGEVVLLAPAAARGDQYPDFEKRGEDFMAQVKAVLGG